MTKVPETQRKGVNGGISDKSMPELQTPPLPPFLRVSRVSVEPAKLFSEPSAYC
jgi:hypothetical protein